MLEDWVLEDWVSPLLKEDWVREHLVLEDWVL